MTIPFLEISFNRIFEYGQAYVALSRATCLEGLYVKSFSPSCIKAHHKVKEFYSKIDPSIFRQSLTSQNEDELVEVLVKDLADLFKELSIDKPDNDEWLEAKVVPKRKRFVSTYQEGNFEDFIETHSNDPFENIYETKQIKLDKPLIEKKPNEHISSSSSKNFVNASTLVKKPYVSPMKSTTIVSNSQVSSASTEISDELKRFVKRFICSKRFI